MEIVDTIFEGLKIIKPPIFKDDRGYFLETYQQGKFKAAIPSIFVQDNLSSSNKNVLRGLHFQKPPFAQGKLIQVLRGKCFDIALDIRKDSPTFGRYFSYTLDAINHHMIFIPEGFAHGFLSLEDDTIFSYKCTQFYSKTNEECILWNDPALSIQWGIDDPIVSEKDQQGKLLKDIPLYF
jgi:dTDP-4-dehydrorhamnose 3,5-epimerase